MWIGKQMAETTRPREDSTAVDLGVTTIGGTSVAAETRGEDRDLPVYGPGGYFWQPKVGDQVLVIKGGVSGDEQCVAGTAQVGAPATMGPGDIYLSSGSASIYLHVDGRIDIEGDLYINGTKYKPCLCETVVPTG